MEMPGDAGNPGELPLPNIVPSAFVSSNHGSQAHMMTLRDCSNNLWHLKIEKMGDSWYFTDGWKEFVDDNEIALGDVLVYENPCEGLIDFKILGPTVSKEEVEFLEYRNANGLEEKVGGMSTEIVVVDEKPKINQDHHPQPKKKDGAAGAGAIIRKRNRNSDFYGAELFHSGEIPQPINPYFVLNANRSRVNELYIPIDVVRCYDLALPDTLVIVDSSGRRYQTKRRKWKDGRVLFYGGWKAVCKVNLMEKDDKIICEFVAGEEGVLELKVTFLHEIGKVGHA